MFLIDEGIYTNIFKNKAWIRNVTGNTDICKNCSKHIFQQLGLNGLNALERAYQHEGEFVPSNTAAMDWNMKRKNAQMSTIGASKHFQIACQQILNTVPCSKIPKLSRLEIDEWSMGSQYAMHGIG